jgi:hypothetical protein
MVKQSFFNALNELQKLPTIINCNDQSVLALSANPKYHTRTQHIEIQLPCIREHVEAGHINVLSY